MVRLRTCLKRINIGRAFANEFEAKEIYFKRGALPQCRHRVYI